MSDDMNKKIKQLTDILGQENIPDNVMNLLSLLASNTEKNNSPGQNDVSPAVREEKKEERGENTYRPEPFDKNDMTSKMVRAISKLNTRDDPRVNLLMAVKPFLNQKRQQNLSNCIKLMSLTRVISLLDEFQDGKEE